MLVRWTSNPLPLPELGLISAQVDEMFRDFFHTPRRGGATQRGRGFTVTETDDGFELKGLLPGVKADALDLSATADSVTISAKRSVDPPEGFRALKRERASLDFERTFNFATPIDVDQIEARLDHGVLTLSIAKSAEAKPRKIQLKA